METIYLIALEISVIFGLLKLFSLKVGIFFSLILIVGIYLFSKKKDIFLILIPCIFLIRAFFLFNVTAEIGDTKKFQLFLYQGRGRVEKIDNNFPLKTSYLYLSNYQDGNYIVDGEIRDIKKFYDTLYYDVDIQTVTKIEEGKIQKYFQDRSSSLLEKCSYSLKRVYDATILGEGYRLTKEMREKFNYIGISHLMSLSGFHIGLVIAVFSYIIQRLPLKKRGQNILLLLFLTIYYMGIEHSPSLDRSYIMGFILLSGKILYENTELMKSLIVSYVVSLCINPATLDTISFQLSYGAVFVIAGIYPFIKTKLYKGKSKILDSLILTLTIQIFLTPLVLKTFGIVQLLSFISNLIVVPVGSLFITLGFIGLFLENLHLGFLIILPLKAIFFIFKELVNFFYSLPLMSIKVDFKSPILSIFYFLLILGVFILKFRKEKTNNEKIYRRTKISQ